ncbi:MAG: hypothetical protein A4E48_02228 [Methanosaeta sp. PtaU1.Bin060]|nr:MAG: hypothetical protein A4E48_02228 [Methanosaeta sp. PtaU1.Bin060]
MDGGIDLKKVILAAVLLVALIGLSTAELMKSAADGQWYNYATSTEKNTSFTFEQSVQGNGYFMTYMYAKEGNLEMKNYAHGSGSIDNQATLAAYHMERTKHPVAEDWNDYNLSCIQFKEDNAMVYAPMKIAVGTGYYAANPVDYSSLLKEKTWVKNYRAATSMHHEVEYAHALDKELDLVAKEKFNYTYDPIYEGDAVTQMKINEDVTDGKVHLGVLQGDQQWVTKDAVKNGANQIITKSPLTYTAWKHPAIEIDEDYWGTYHIEKNMTLDVPYKRIEASDDWLPCCFGGYMTMPTYYQKGSYGFGSNVKGVFDCTCFKALEQAEFPRVY